MRCLVSSVMPEVQDLGKQQRVPNRIQTCFALSRLLCLCLLDTAKGKTSIHHHIKVMRRSCNITEA